MDESQVPVAVRRRLATVLSHLAKNQKEPCEGAVRHQTCNGGAIDMEDLASSTVRLHAADKLDEKPDVLFDPKRFAATQRPLLEASTLPPEVYSSRAWYLKELERVFAPSWTLVGREDEMMEPGNYLAVDTEWGGPIAVVRGKDGGLHSFANACAHRGAKILADGAGKAPRAGLICPYHAWTYDYSGQLIIAPGMMKSIDFDEDNIRLTPVRLETFHGFIFVNHREGAKPLAESLGDLPEKLPEWFGADGEAQRMVCVARRSYDVPCNWKLIFENTCETYHTSVVHKGSLGPMKSRPMEPHVGDWDGVRVPTERSIVPLPSEFEGDNAPLPTFTNKSAFINLFPSLQINVTWDCLWWMSTRPTGENSTHIDMGFCFPAQTTKLDIFPSRLERYLHRWNMAVKEDCDISMNQTRGLRSALRKVGRFCEIEFGTHNFNNWLLSKVLDNPSSAWDPGSRIFKATGDLWSNDDKEVLMLAEQVSTKQEAGTKPAPPLKPSPTSARLDLALASGTRVCVTGATGFIGLHVVNQLLARGCHVVAAVRNASDERKMAPLLAMQGTGQGRLTVVGGCEVLAAGSFDKAVAECEACFHLASPFWMDNRISDPHSELIAPAQQGTVNLLHSCMSSLTMRRVIVTSSFGAIMNIGGNKPWPLDFSYSEAHWNESSAPVKGEFPEPRNVHAYRWSKTVAEQAVWDFVATEQPHFSVACICPPMVLGPNLQKLSSPTDINQSSLIIFKMLSGEMKHVMPGSVGFVDVRDVAKAHILAAETPAAASKRYLCSGTTKTWLQVSQLLRDLFPTKPIPTTCEDGSVDGQPCLTLDTSRIRQDLGINFLPLVETLKEQVGSFLEVGLLG